MERADRATVRALVICCNDAVMAVHLGTEEEATVELERLAREDYGRNHWHWDDEARRYGVMFTTGYQLYRHRCYWHLHDVPIVG